jgi:fluoroacetyl-CoA thioesterase
MTESVSSKIILGMEGFCERVVTPELTLLAVDPTWPAVFSTPAMIAMMELASSLAVRSALPPESMTVGVRIEVDHLRAIPIGAAVTAVSRLVEMNGRRLVFEAEAKSGGEVIGRGRIFQAIVEHARFAAKAAGKPASR